MRVKFEPRGLDEDISIPHNKTIEALTLTEYSEFKTHSKVYAFAEKHYDSGQEPKQVSSKLASKPRKRKSEAVAEQEQAEQGVSSFNSETEKDLAENHQHKVYRKFNKDNMKLSPVLELSESEYLKEHDKAVERLVSSGSVSKGDPSKQIFDNILRSILKMLDHRGYINDYLTMDQNRQKLQFNRTELAKDAFYKKKENKHNNKIEEDYKIIAGEMNKGLKKPSQELANDLNSILSFYNKGNDFSKMNKQQSKFFNDILIPMIEKIDKFMEKGEEVNYDKLGKIYVETKKEALNKDHKKEMKKGKSQSYSLSM
jgi:hypothetical protein